jgi:lipopolysaccharide export system permease protein
MLMLPLLAVSLAVPPKRSTSGLGIFVGILIVVAYHKVNQYADAVAEQGRIEPLVAFWFPFVLLCGLILWMYRTLAHKPGGQPIGALERFLAKSAKTVRGMLPKPKEA